jgi:hypothetical protein
MKMVNAVADLKILTVIGLLPLEQSPSTIACPLFRLCRTSRAPTALLKGLQNRRRGEARGIGRPKTLHPMTRCAAFHAKYGRVVFSRQAQIPPPPTRGR